MTKEELLDLIGEENKLTKTVDVRTLVLDIVRERMNEGDILNLFWNHLKDVDEPFLKDYFYRQSY
ncbi:MAG: hypothetical protein KC476_10475 [Cyanobacteria bacterium HKST-UBA06]|nr:hypothetical protein [Cyanobacteria bacterium HKST-UBA05]MCA9798814.1 hypothetical protein [Cyanobacteria bacterium HKST-UBA04]MCA9808367.1 hypothetical protein [Cyanobacteria bacterium HKST-UBA06]MCA9841849.1 hypothetical protein [Cyanobacteria bacterium HKST-UBA03]